MTSKHWIRKISINSIVFIALVLLFTLGLKLYTSFYIFDDKEKLPTSNRVAVVFGAKLKKNGKPSVYLQDRLDAALELYCAGKVDVIVLSGEKINENFNEIDAMERYILDAGIPLKDTYLDTGGIDTYSTVYRMKHIFQFDEVILISQNFHLTRATFLARLMGMNSVGYNADKHEYNDESKHRFREVLANVKAALDLSKDRAAEATDVKLDSVKSEIIFKPALQK